MNNKFNKCRHCNSNQNTVILMEGFKGCIDCLGDYIKNNKLNK